MYPVSRITGDGRAEFSGVGGGAAGGGFPTFLGRINVYKCIGAYYTHDARSRRWRGWRGRRRRGGGLILT